MKSVRLLLIFVLLLNLSWCNLPWSKKAATLPPPKKDFIITVTNINKTASGGYITKSAKVLGTSEIMLSAQTAWRIIQITTKIGQNISANAWIAKMEDTAGNTKFGYQKSLAAINSANNTYEVSKLNLDKQISDAKLNLDRSDVTYTNIISDSDKQLEKLQRDLSNNDITNTGGTLFIQLQKLNTDLEKAKIDQNTKIRSDDQTIANTILSAKNIYTDLNSIYQDTKVLSENILQPIDIYLQRAWLGAKDVSAKSRAYASYDIFAWQANQIKNIWNDINSWNLATYLQNYKIYIWYINDMAISLKNVISNSVSAGITQWQLDWYSAQVVGLQSRVSGILGNITNQLNGSNSFLNSYQDTQNSIAKQIESLQSQITLTKKQLDDAAFATQNWYDRTKIWIDTSTTTSQISKQWAQSNYDFAINTKNPNLQSIKNQLQTAQIWLTQTQFDMAKFDIKSPIAWVIADIYVDLWQDVSPGTPIAKIVSKWQEIEISLSETEKKYISMWDEVIIVNTIWTGVGKITALSPVADKNWNYKVVIGVYDSKFDIWSFVDVRIPLSSASIAVPINNIRILDNGFGSVILWDGSWFVNQTVKLGDMFGDDINISTDIPSKYQIVTSDISNYDPNTMNIKIKK